MWSLAEASQYIRTLKAYENRTKNQLNGLSKASTIMEQAIESLSCPQMKVQKRDAEKLLDKYGSLHEIIMQPDYSEFEQIDGIGKTKVERLT